MRRRRGNQQDLWPRLIWMNRRKQDKGVTKVAGVMQTAAACRDDSPCSTRPQPPFTLGRGPQAWETWHAQFKLAMKVNAQEETVKLDFLGLLLTGRSGRSTTALAPTPSKITEA